MSGANFCRKYRLMLWKNFLVKKRHWFCTILEVFLPIVATLLISLLRGNLPDFQAIHVKDPVIYPVEKVEHCEYFNLIYSPKNVFSEKIMKKVTDTLPKAKTYPCNSEEDVELQFFHLKNDHENQNVFGIIFDETTDEAKNFSYKIRPIQTIGTYWYTESLVPLDPQSGPMEISDLYLRDCFITLQLTIDKAFIIESMNGAEFPYEFQFQKFPYPPYVSDSVLSTIFSKVLPLTIIWSFYMLFLQLVKRVVEEKSSGAKELLSMMGMGKGMQWLGWFTSSMAVIVIDLVIIIIFLIVGFHGIPILKYSDGFLVFLFLFMFCFSSVLSVFVIAAFTSKESIAVTIVTVWILFTGNIPFIIGNQEIGFLSKMLLSIIPNVGLHYGFEIVAFFEGRTDGLQWSNVWSTPKSKSAELNMGCVFTMFIVGIFIWWLLILYLDRVMPGKYGIARPWHFPLTAPYRKIKTILNNKKSYSCENERLAHRDVNDQIYNGMQKPEFEPLPFRASAGIQIREVKKVFGKGLFGGEVKVAVDGVSLDILEGEITALLGHNGAGKTTLISILTGMFSATEGKVRMGRYDIEKDMDSIRQGLGLCPQYSMLFPALTVWEHLVFFSMSKGQSFSAAKAEAEDFLIKLDMHSKKNELSSKLSGGMKRKLSLGMALVGNSQILILDEPTSGMDPDSRRLLWDLLLSMRGHRTILLTTHYMEEADVLGDRIAIMHKGKVHCFGTSLFLKKLYGTGYHLKLLIDKDKEVDISAVTNTVKEAVPGSSIVNHTEAEINYSLPTNATDSFSSMFEQIDNKGKSLGVKGLSVNVTTLEEVFLRVGKLMDGEEKPKTNSVDQTDIACSSSQEDFNSRKASGIELLLLQAEALSLKKILFCRAMWLQLIPMAIIGLALFVFGMQVLSPKTLIQEERSLTFSVLDYENSHAFTSGFGDHGKKAESIYIKLLSEHGATVESVKEEGVIEALIKAGSKDEAAYRDSYVVSAAFSDASVTVLYSTTLYHSCPTSLNLITTTLLRLLTNKDDRLITTTIQPFSDSKYSESNEGQKYLLACVLTMFGTIGLVLVTSIFIMLPVLEGASGARHLQLMTLSSSAFLYWIVSLLVDMTIQLILALITVVIAAVLVYSSVYGGHFLGCLFVIFIAFGLCGIPFGYLISYFKKTVGSAMSFYSNLSIIWGFILGITVIVMESLLDYRTVTFILRILGILVPSFPLMLCLMKFSLISSYNTKCSMIPSDLKEKLCTFEGITSDIIHPSCCENLCEQFGNCFKPISYFGWGSFSPKSSAWINQPEGMLMEITIMLLLCPVYLAILCLIDKGIIPIFYERILECLTGTCRKSIDDDDELEGAPEDDDVYKEKDRVDFLLQSNYVQEGKDILIAHKLHKNYGWFRCVRGGKRAVRGVTFSVDSGTCFGLLGANGAGKTSTFDMITGVHPMSSGMSYILGAKCINFGGKNKKYQASIGYCPQFNATLGVLTGRQTLKLYASLRGIPRDLISQEVKKWIDHLDLHEPADRPCKDYSGGNHRRLSTAMALMGECPLICLDEPTSGVDPVARRKLWDAVDNAKSKGAALVLTSHSMEECEVLCSKLSIMVDGKFVCIGSVPYLKQKYGQGYTLLVKLNVSLGSPEGIQPLIEELKEAVENAFRPCALKDEHQGLLHYHIIDPQTKWKYMFSTMEDFKIRFSPLIEDYSLSDTTLEQVFLSFVRKQKNPEDET